MMNVPELKKRLAELRALFPELLRRDCVRLKREFDRAVSRARGEAGDRGASDQRSFVSGAAGAEAFDRRNCRGFAL